MGGPVCKRGNNKCHANDKIAPYTNFTKVWPCLCWATGPFIIWRERAVSFCCLHCTIRYSRRSNYFSSKSSVKFGKITIIVPHSREPFIESETHQIFRTTSFKKFSISLWPRGMILPYVYHPRALAKPLHFLPKADGYSIALIEAELLRQLKT